MKDYKIVFWDFDGVIKDSVDVKTNAFIKLFESYGTEVAEKVKQHHEANGGMSRFIKFPIYLSYAGEKITTECVNELSNVFSQIVFDEVVNSDWVSGAEEYLRKNPNDQTFVLVSATPQEEINHILKALNLTDIFKMVYGAPANKKESLRLTLEALNILPNQCVMIGDAIADFAAAVGNNIPFILRRHNSNGAAFAGYTGRSINDITDLL